MLEQWKSLLRVKERTLPALDLPTDFPRPPVRNQTRGGLRSFALPQVLADDLRTFCRSSGNTMYSVLLSAVSIALHKLSRQEEIVVGTPLANRHVQDFENTVGYFINPCPIPVAITPQTTVAQLFRPRRTVQRQREGSVHLRASIASGFAPQPFSQMLRLLVRKPAVEQR